MLAQSTGGKEQVVAFASRTLTKAERRYCATRCEMLALVWAIRHFRPYLYGKPFMVCTDQFSQVVESFKDPEGQLARWLEILREYQFTVEHRPGNKHSSNAHALSRIPCKQCGWQEELEEPPVQAVVMATEILLQNNSHEVWGWKPTWSPEELCTL